MEARRAHRPTARGLASRLKSANSIDQDTASIDSEECHVYSNRVAEVFNSLPQMPLVNPSTSTPSPSGLYCYSFVSVSVLMSFWCFCSGRFYIFCCAYDLWKVFKVYLNFASSSVRNVDMKARKCHLLYKFLICWTFLLC